MDEPSPGILLLIILLICLSSFFSASETALLSIGRPKVRALLQGKKRGAQSLDWLKKHPKKSIITVLIGTNIVNTLIPVLATLWTTAKFGSHIVGIVTGILTLISLVFSEIIPKNLGQIYNERISLIVAPFLYFLARGLMPLVWIFEKFSDLLLTKKKQDPITEEEVLAMVSLGAEGGAIEAEEQELIENVLEFTDTTAEEVMTPRIDIEAIHADTTLGEAIEFFARHAHSRLPVFEGSIDHVVGIITVRQALRAWKEYEPKKLVKNLELNPPLFAPTTKKIADLFRDLQHQRLHMAIIVNEHGGTAGLVTMEDILEEVFGEIADESDVEDPVVRELSTEVWNVPGSIALEKLQEYTGIAFADTAQDPLKPLSRFILEQTEDIPERGQSIEIPGAALVIEKMAGHRIDRVRILKKNAVAAETSPAETP